MNTIKLFFVLAVISVFTLIGCSDDDDMQTDTTNLTLDITGLEDLGDEYVYEGWIIVNGSPVSAGIFNVNTDGSLTKSSFDLDRVDLESATAYVLTIEPSPDSDPSPSDVHILAGDFSGNQADLTTDHGSAIGTDFINSSGSYILATPTDGGSNTNELSGVWWLNPSAGPGAGLDLPTLPSGWIYEGWAVINGSPISTGTFTSVAGADDFNGFSGTAAAGPPFPGEDLLMNAPEEHSFPTNLSGGAVVISVEPVPDNSSAPFLLKPLVGMVPSDAQDHTLYGMDNNAEATNPQGTVSR